MLELKMPTIKQRTESPPAQVSQRQAQVASENVRTPIRYKAKHLKRIIRANGTYFLPDAEGYYQAKTHEEYELLKYFASLPYGYLETVNATKS